jgi:hypothetical protein|tara:strand:+ start:4396 stop:4671 length:276 start_codon:yes stop_codon:yes gene_type:complete
VAKVIGPDDYVDLPVAQLVATMMALLEEFEAFDGKRTNLHENWSVLGAVRIRADDISEYCTEIGLKGVNSGHVRSYPAQVIAAIRQFMEQR